MHLPLPFLHSLTQAVRRYTESRPPDLLIGSETNPFIKRWRLFRRNKLFNIYLHVMLRDDYDFALHDHRYENISIVLEGWYVEHFRDRVRYRHPGDVIFRRATTAHRLELLGPEDHRFPALTIFVTGPWRRTWGLYMKEGWRPFYEVVDAPSDGKGVSKRK